MVYIGSENEYRYLSHHGVKGQKHGERRYQYEDGSLTPLGRMRMRMRARKERKSEERRQSAIRVKRQAAVEKRKATIEEKKRRQQEELAKEKAAADDAEALEKKKWEIAVSGSPKTVMENSKLFNDNELDSIRRRLDIERQIKAMSPATISRGAQMVNSLANAAKTINSVYESGSKIYNIAAQIHNSVSSEKAWPILGKDKKGQKDNSSESSGSSPIKKALNIGQKPQNGNTNQQKSQNKPQTGEQNIHLYLHDNTDRDNYTDFFSKRDDRRYKIRRRSGKG